MEADFVIIGAGSAGCTLAYRLSESGASVLVIEAGGSDAGPLIQMPAALSYPMNMRRYDWGYKTEPEPHLGGRVLAAPRGKLVGGSSSINGMVYVRGHGLDFDCWQQMGATGWSYRDVLPYFKKMECWHGGHSALRGTGGPLHVTRGPGDNPLHRAFIAAGIEAGYPYTDDYNGAQQEGFGPMEQTVYHGRRWSTANAYLRPALRRFACRLVKGLASRIEIEDGAATRVEIIQGERKIYAKARREIILSASAFNGPAILMRSGIGPAKQLQAHGIPIVRDCPAVGEKLQDHLEIYIQMAAAQPVSLYKYWNIWGKAWIGAQWLLTKTGLGASNQFETAAFIRSKPGIAYPDIQYHFLPLAVRYDGKVAANGHGFQAHVGPMRSMSRGCVALRSDDPRDPPIIRFNYMSAPEDWADFRAAIRLTREIFAQTAFNPYTDFEIQPGANCQSDESLDAFIRDHVESAYHPCGTLRMGSATDHEAVVDPETRVIGIRRLRVVDSSIFPRITNGNLNAPTIMLAEKASDHILGRLPLAPIDYVPWTHPDWQQQQR